MPIHVERVNCSDLIFESVAQLRYAVYAEEEHQDLPTMDHDQRTLVDTLDPHSLTYAAIDNGVVVGTLRLTPIVALPRNAPTYLRFGASRLPVPQDKQLLVGRLMVATSHRGGPACLMLFATAYREALANGFEVAYAECNPRNLPLYESVGCRQVGQPFCDAIYGLNVGVVLVLRDFDHLEAMRSPLRPLTGAHANNAILTMWAKHALAPWSGPRSLRLKKIGLQSELYEEIVGIPHSPFAALPTADARRALRAATVFELEEGAEVLRPGSSCTEAFIVLKGEVTLNAARHTVGGLRAVVGKGQIFNESALLEGQPTKSRIAAFASRQTRLLALSAESLDSLRGSRPAVAAAIEAGLLLLRTRQDAQDVRPGRGFGCSPGVSTTDLLLQNSSSTDQMRECDHWVPRRCIILSHSPHGAS